MLLSGKGLLGHLYWKLKQVIENYAALISLLNISETKVQETYEEGRWAIPCCYIWFSLQETEASSVLESVVRKMEGTGFEFHPNPEVSKFHDSKYRVFLEMLQDQIKYRDIMQDWLSCFYCFFIGTVNQIHWSKIYFIEICLKMPHHCVQSVTLSTSRLLVWPWFNVIQRDTNSISFNCRIRPIDGAK